MLTAYSQHCNCVCSMRLAVPLLHHFCFIQWARATEVVMHCTWLRSWKSVKCFYLLFSATSVCLVLSNLPSLKEVIRSNMQYKNTICSYCQPWDETNLLSIYSDKVIETVKFHRGLRSTNWRLLPLWGLYSVHCRKSRIWGFILGATQVFLWQLKIKRLLPLLIDYSDVLNPGLYPAHYCITLLVSLSHSMFCLSVATENLVYLSFKCCCMFPFANNSRLFMHLSTQSGSLCVNFLHWQWCAITQDRSGSAQ